MRSALHDRILWHGIWTGSIATLAAIAFVNAACLDIFFGAPILLVRIQLAVGFVAAFLAAVLADRARRL